MMQSREFLAGVATSGYQSEGGYNGPHQPQNNWTWQEGSLRIARTGGAVDFWNRYREDFALASGIGLNAFRLSIEWSRVQPTTVAEKGPAPDFDGAALDGYADRIAACRASGLEPIVTLHHFTHPAWLGLDAWLDDETPQLFEAFVRRTVVHVNRRLAEFHQMAPVRWYVTLNEPNMLVLNTYLNRHFPGGLHAGIGVGVRAYNRLLSAHVRAYNAIHDIYADEGWTAPQVTMNTFCSDVYWSENMLLDLLCLRENEVRWDELPEFFRARAAALRAGISNARLALRGDFFAAIGRGVHWLADVFASRAATREGFAFFLAELERSPRATVLDFLGVDYYDPFIGHIFRPPSFADLEFPSGSLHGHLMDGVSSKWWDWHFLPEGLHAFCTYYAKAFPGRSILIAENGMAQRRKSDNSAGSARRDKVTRSEFLRAHLGQVRRLLDEGVPLLGYLHWSLTDNFEWGSFTPRFGLFRIDYMNGLKRHAEDELGDNPSATYTRLLGELQLIETEKKVGTAPPDVS
ncbi:MAG: family 1 glycosylhydrolase [Terrimicrobiaceae bacterium]|nr:family 1 glycosylhydrolase [Terrimicrobiaceae bacterium]